MKTLEEIKEEYAKELGWNGWGDLLLNAGGTRQILDRDYNEAAKRYAKEVAREALSNSSDNARVMAEDSLKPILLTGEILLKCGFDRTEYNDYRHPVLIGTLTLYEGIAELHLSDMYSVWVNSLHHLQNLFYALCGEELEVKL